MYMELTVPIAYMDKSMIAYADVLLVGIHDIVVLFHKIGNLILLER